jgi:hypothetical protein
VKGRITSGLDGWEKGWGSASGKGSHPSMSSKGRRGGEQGVEADIEWEPVMLSRGNEREGESAALATVYNLGLHNTYQPLYESRSSILG